MSEPRHALVIVLNTVAIDPRVRREIDWLTSAGWAVDSLGMGELADGIVDTHFRIADPPSWSRTRLGRALMHALLPNRSKFRILGTGRFPREVSSRVRSGFYELVVFNDIELIPWVSYPGLFDATPRIHLDLHEYFPHHLPKGSALRIRVDSYYRWTRRFISHRVFTSRSSVASRIGELYENEFGFAPLGIVRNPPPFVDQSPRPVDPQRIELLHHGIAAWERGLRDLVAAMHLVEDRFHLTLMLTGHNSVHEELRTLTAEMSHRITFAPPVAMADVASEINKYDLEVLYYRPTTQNLLLALPNKLFEAVQGRLGLVIGESPMMTDVVSQYSNGLVVKGWSAEELAAGINSLTAVAIEEFKAASNAAAPFLSAEHESTVFLSMIEARD